MECPDAESIAELISAHSDPDARAAFADHAAACESCHAVVDVLFDHTVVLGVGASDAGMPARIDRYVVRRKLGSGGMGVVYVAHDPELDREVAIKMLRRGVAASRLRREAQSLARLSHPNVVAVHDVGEHDGQVFVAMALVDGVNLRAWLRQPRDTSDIMRVLSAAGRGIVAAHTAGLVHRDLKPDNIFIAASGEVLVGDFGLARDSEDEPDRTSIEGTPAYMPPEQAEGHADERADQYSFCVMAFEALYGKRPFAGKSLEEIHANAREGRFVEVRVRDAGVDRALRRGLRADPAERFDSMSELLHELEPRSRAWIWLAAAGMLAVGGAITATWFATRTDPIASAEEQCSSAGTPTWNPLVLGAVEASLRVRGSTPDAIVEITKRLDQYAMSWTEVRRDACLALVGDRITPVQASARVACLGTRKTAFEVTVQSLIETPAEITVTWRRVTTIAPPASCNSDDAPRLSSGTAEHQALMRDLAIAVNADAEGLAIAKVAEKAAMTTDVPARLEIALVQASDALENKRMVAADAALEIARPLAEQLDVASTRVRAFALTARSHCIQSRYAEANHFLAMATAGAQRLRTSESEAEMDEVFLARTECMYQRHENEKLAPMLVERIAYVQKRYGRDSFEEAALHQRLSLVYNDLGRKDESAHEYDAGFRIYMRFERADEAAAIAEDNAAVKALQAGDLDGAIAHGKRSIELLAKLKTPDLLEALVGFAPLLDTAQDRKGAIEVYSQVIAMIPADTPDETTRSKLAEAYAGRGYDRVIVGDLDGAIADLQVAIAAAEKVKRIDLALEARLSLGKAWFVKGELDRSVRVLRESIDAYAKTANPSNWRIADSQFIYAQVSWETGDKPTARVAGKKAEKLVADIIEQTKGNPLAARFVPIAEATLASIERWRDAHP